MREHFVTAALVPPTSCLILSGFFFSFFMNGQSAVGSEGLSEKQADRV